MRGYAEESDEVKARRALFAAARKYAGVYLAAPFEITAQGLEACEAGLEIAAEAFGAARVAANKPCPRAKKKAPK